MFFIMKKENGMQNKIKLETKRIYNDGKMLKLILKCYAQLVQSKRQLKIYDI